MNKIHNYEQENTMIKEYEITYNNIYFRFKTGFTI